MPRDYAKKAPAPSKKASKKPASNPTPGWVWLLSGLAVGLFVAFLVYLNQAKLPPPEAVLPATVPPKTAKVEKPKPVQKPKAEPRKPSFNYDFYTLLPEFEVVVPEDRNAPAGQPPKPVEQPGSYLLQVGSFRSASDADTRKAELAMLGLVSSVQSATVDGGTTWHRVRLGPYKDLAKLNSVRDRLRENGIDFMLLKERS